jgi:hypothetical protein
MVEVDEEFECLRLRENEWSMSSWLMVPFALIGLVFVVLGVQ